MLFGVAVVISPSVFIAVSCSVLWVYHNLSGSVIPPLLSSSRVSSPFAFPCFPGGSDGKESAHSGGELGSIPGLGRSSGEGKGYPLQYSDLENSMDCIVHRVAKSWTQLSDFHFHHNFHLLFHTHCRISLEVSTKVLWETYWHFIVPMGQFVKNWHLI